MVKKKEAIVNKKEILGRKAVISYFEIFILLVSTFAFSYFMYQVDLIINKELNKPENQKVLQELKQQKENSGLVAVVKNVFNEWMKRSSINLVSAGEKQTPAITEESFNGFGWQSSGAIIQACCSKLKNGATCQNIISTQCASDCAGDCLPTKCENIAGCKPGCCIDNNEGTCSLNTPKDSCKGTWSQDKGCNINECRNGCCVIGSQAVFTTDKRCDKISSSYGLVKDFKKSITTEIGCLQLANSAEEGACIFKLGTEKSCRFTTKADCLKLTKEATSFFPGYLCSNPSLNITCQKQVKTGCVDGKDEVYWFDSCGNRENIYSSNKDASWNSGRVLKKEESCSLNAGNSADCGNCNYFTGSVCSKYKTTKPTYGNYICQDLNCKDAPDNVGIKDRRNGESWCVYDGYVGDGRDVVGSRQYKYYCINGKIQVEPCGDFRTGLCVQGKTETSQGDFYSAACRPNQAMSCISYNGKEENKDPEKLKEECEKNSDCEVSAFDFGKGYRFNVCTPKYPPGFDMKDHAEEAEKICAQANFKCTKILVKGWGGWSCKSGCECDSQQFTQKMNDWCGSLGDCGGKVNTLAKTDKGYRVSEAPEIDLEQYKQYAIPKAGQFVDPGDFSDILANQYGWGSGSHQQPYQDKPNSGLEMLGTIGGSLGTMAFMGTAGTGQVTLNAMGAAGGGQAFMAGFAGAAAAGAVGAGVGLMAAKIFGLKGEAVTAVVAAGAIAGIAVSVGISIMAATATSGSAIYIAGTSIMIAGAGQGAAGCLATGPAAIFCLAIIVIVVLIMVAIVKAMGIGDVDKTEVLFYCNPYEPPRGGADCGKCTTELTDGGLKECTQYRCQSLGQTCEFINQGTGNELCIDISPGDVSAPLISPSSFISPGYNYTNVSSKGFIVSAGDGSCIPEFTPVMFGIDTNEPSQCMYEFNHTIKYDDMRNPFGGSELFKYNHSMAFFIPSADSLLAEQIGQDDNISQEEITNLQNQIAGRMGDWNMLVRCIDKKGNYNPAEYTIKTCIKPGNDLTPATVIASEPASGSYLTYGKESADLRIYINEPAECKWDYNNQDYSSMQNNMSCLTELSSAELYGWPCNASVGNLNNDENKIYIRCKDQPWLEGKETENKTRNINTQGREIILKASKNPLIITSIKPNSTIFSEKEPVSATLEVTTSGGVDGKAECSYGFLENSFKVPFLNTFSTAHTQPFTLLMKGDYNVNVECKDVAGNIATGETGFSIDVDTNSPQVTRTYNKAGNLYIETDEEGECRYSLKSCNFDWENATSMGRGKSHTAKWDEQNFYYVKCKDIYNNEPLACSIVVKPNK